MGPLQAIVPTRVFLTSAELAAVTAIKGRLPTPDEYRVHAATIDTLATDIYRYLEFDKLRGYGGASPTAS